MLRATLAVAALASAACTERFSALEPWQARPEIRVIAVLTPSERRAFAVAGADSFELPLGSAFDRGETTQVWIHGYRLETLAQAFPGLAGRSAEEVAAALDPSLEPDANTRAAPPADELLEGSIASGAMAEVAYQARSFSDWKAAGAAALLFRISDETICRGFEVTRVAAPSGVLLQAIAALDAERALAAGISADGTVQSPTRFFRVTGTRFEELPGGLESGGARAPIVYDATADTVFGAAGDGRLFRIAVDGARTELPQIPGGAAGVAIARDGTAFAFASFFGLYDLAGGRWNVHASFGDFRVEALLAVRPDLLAILSNCWVFDDDGTTSVRRLLDPDCDTLSGRGNTILTLAGDDDGIIATGRGGYAWVRDGGGDRTWREASPPIGRADLGTAAALGGARYLVAGKGGALAIDRGDRWCALDAGSPAVDFSAASVEPGGRRAVLVGTANGSSAVLVRVSIPPSGAL